MRGFPITLLAVLAISSGSSALAATDVELAAALASIRSMEARIAGLEKRVAELEGSAPAAPTLQAPAERAGWIEKMRVELKKAEAQASGPWTSASSWAKVRVGMPVEELVSILGEPTSRKFSIRKRTDEILYYEGTLDGTGAVFGGEVRVYKGKVTSLEAPEFP